MTDCHFRKSFLSDMINNHIKYETPLNFNLFKDEYGIPLTMNKEVKTEEEAKEYFNKLCNILGDEYKLQYYEVDTDDDLKNLTFDSDIEIEKIIRLIALDSGNKFKIQSLKLGVITLDLSNIRNHKGKQFYKDFFNKVKKILNENES